MSRGSALAILLVFALLLPLLGGLIFAVALSIWTAVAHPEANEGLMALVGMLALLPVAYMTVGLQALLIGIVAAAAALWRERLEWWPALGAATVFGGIQAVRLGEDLPMQTIFLASHIGAAALCLLICRMMLRRAKPT